VLGGTIFGRLTGGAGASAVRFPGREPFLWALTLRPTGLSVETEGNPAPRGRDGVKPAVRIVSRLEQASGRGSSACALIALLLAAALVLTAAPGALAAPDPTPDPSPQIQPDPAPQQTPVPPTPQRAPVRTAPAPATPVGVSAPPTSTAGSAQPVSAAKPRHAAARHHPASRPHHRPRVAQQTGASRRLPVLLSGMRLRGFAGLTRTVSTTRPDGRALLLAAIALLLVVTAAGSFLHATLGVSGRDFYRRRAA
jgi:hypothetical protein